MQAQSNTVGILTGNTHFYPTLKMFTLYHKGVTQLNQQSRDEQLVKTQGGIKQTVNVRRRQIFLDVTSRN